MRKPKPRSEVDKLKGQLKLMRFDLERSEQARHKAVDELSTIKEAIRILMADEFKAIRAEIAGLRVDVENLEGQGYNQ